MGVTRKWHISTSGGAANLGGVSGDLFEHRGSGIPLLGITSLNRHFCAQIDWANKYAVTFFIALLNFGWRFRDNSNNIINNDATFPLCIKMTWHNYIYVM